MNLSSKKNSLLLIINNRKLTLLFTLFIFSVVFIFSINSKQFTDHEGNQIYSMGQFIPKDEDIILTIKSITKSGKNDASEKNKSENHAAHQSWEQTASIINEDIASFQETSLLLYLSQAETLLNNWIKNNTPHYETYLYQARLAQMQHFFEPALNALDHAITMSPEKPEAYLLNAYIKLSIGKPLEAIPYCKKSVQASAMLSLSCLSTAQARIGQEEIAYQQLQKALAHFNNLTAIERSEAYYSLAEISLQKNIESTEYFKEALKYQPENTNLRIRFIDTLIDKKEYSTSEALIEDYDQHPAIKTRKLYIDKELGKNISSAYQEVSEYFQTQSLLDTNYSSREQAFFYLYIENNPTLSLKTSYKNWKNHPEPEDALMVLKTAVILQDQQKIAEIIQWKNNLGYQDERFNLLIDEQISKKVK